MSMFDENAPIGFVLYQAAKITGGAFEAFLFGDEGGSLSTWLVLLALQENGTRHQSELAAFAGIQGPTVTHHLNAMESQGLICRVRSSDDRRMHLVTITKTGRARFRRLQAKAKAFDAALRKALGKNETRTLRDLLSRVTEAAARAQAI
jgi:MarR family transcriptional regulator for hemolysin